MDIQKLFGTTLPEPAPVSLKAGRLSLELFSGMVRNIRCDGVEVLRGIAFVARDPDWGAMRSGISDPEIHASDSNFTVKFGLAIPDQNRALDARATIRGSADGSLEFSVDGQVLTDLITNRTGFVILHPLEGIAGQSVEVVHCDGTRTHKHIPVNISPGQPIFRISSLTHTLQPGTKATLEMRGADFEMEDHRNWMDASFKTYSGSLLDPWPYTIPAGTRVKQSVTLSMSGPQKMPARVDGGEQITVSLGGLAGHIPDFGTGLPLTEPGSVLEHIGLLAAAVPAYLQGRIDQREIDHRQDATQLAEIANRTGIPLRLELILSTRTSARIEAADAARVLTDAGLEPEAIIITQNHHMKSFQPGDPLPSGPDYEELATAAREVFPGTLIGGGVVAFFTELNRLPVPEGLFDFVTHSVCPTVHATDDRTVMENLEAMGWIAQSVRQMIGTTPYHLAPSWISTRVNPYGATVFPNPDDERMCLAEADPRERGLFGASWLLGLATTCSNSGLDAVGLASLDGLVASEPGSRVVPAWHVVRGLSARSGHSRIFTDCGTNETRVSALAIETGHGPELWLANLTPHDQQVRTTGLPDGMMMHLVDLAGFGNAGHAEFLDTAGVPLPASGLILLTPYAFVRISPGPSQTIVDDRPVVSA